MPRSPVSWPASRSPAEDVVRVDVQLGEARHATTSAPRAALPPTFFVLREVRAGELIPRSAVGPRDRATSQPVALQVDATSGVHAASRVGRRRLRQPPEPPPTKGSGGPGRTFAGPELALEGVTVVGLVRGRQRHGGRG